MKSIILTLFVVSLWIANSASASIYSDAPDPYGDAWHDDAMWQQLGNDWTTDDGVWWSIDGGTSWGHSALTVGDAVTFRFDLWRSYYGAELYYNQVKAWVDWNQDGFWSNDPTETVLDKKVYRDYMYPVAGMTTLTSESYLITKDMIGDLWLRARASCDPNMLPYGYVWQGEVEDWQVTVVPEPTTILLLGAGTLCLIGSRFRAVT